LTTEYHRIQRAIQSKIERLSSIHLLSDWKFAIDPGPHAGRPDFDDTAWASVTIPHSWSSQDGEGWFRTCITLPQEFDGIQLAGSALDLDLFLTIGATVTINGEQKLREPFWSDTRAIPLRITDSLEPGQPLHIAIECVSGDGFALLAQSNLYDSAIAAAIYRLDLLNAQLGFTHYLAEKQGAQMLSTWEAAANALDAHALAANRWQDWQTSVARTYALLEPFKKLAEDASVSLVGHSHIDMNWLWPMEETKSVCRRDFTTVDKLMQRYPDFRFSQSQATVYDFMENEQPELFERMKTRIHEKRWEVTAATWVEGDLNLAAGEAIVRQRLHAHRYTQSRFGLSPRICWEPDTFGHPAMLPQILAKTGIRYYYSCRAGFHHPLFHWQSPDGSTVLAVQDPFGYGATVTPSALVDSYIAYSGRYDLPGGLLVYGVGDHGGGATIRDIETAQAVQNETFMPKPVFSAAVPYYEQAETGGANIPTVKSELNTVFEGCYTSHGDIKHLNRSAENELLNVESLAALALSLAGYSGGQAGLAEAWKSLCFHQFHDILCGCAIHVTYREAAERFRTLFENLRTVRKPALECLTARLDTSCAGGSSGIVVFNPLAIQRSGVVRLPLTDLTEAGVSTPAAVAAEDGAAVPVQVSAGEILFVASNVPSFAARVYRFLQIAPEDCALVPAQADPGANTLENGFLRLHVHPASGAIDRLVDLRSGRGLTAESTGFSVEGKVNAGMLNRLQILWEQPHPMSAWNIGDITRIDNLISGAEVKVVETGPVRASIEIRRSFLHSSLIQRVVLYQGITRIDFETEVDWHERGSAHSDAPMLRAVFTPTLGKTRATFETAFLGLERPADGREVPALRWADLSEESASDASGCTQQPYGISLLNDGKYGHQANGNTLGITLLRASYEPDNNPDEGLHHFTYSLYPHEGDWKTAGTLQQAAAFNQPLQAVVTGAHPGDLQPNQAWLTCDAPGVFVTAVKPAEPEMTSGAVPAARDVIVRLVETHGLTAQAVLSGVFALQSAQETDLLEQSIQSIPVIANSPQTAWKLELSFKPFEIKTVRLHLDPEVSR
jgi:alpha-mannosidase